MNKYKVKEGTHIEGKKVYTKDQIVKSEKPLAKLFPVKFEDLGPVTPSPSSTEVEESTAKKGKKSVADRFSD